MVNEIQDALWLQQILQEFGFQQQHPTSIWCDKQSSINFSNNPIQPQRRKHIELHMNFIRNLIHDRVIEVLFSLTKYQFV
jgi:hypothetical protein